MSKWPKKRLSEVCAVNPVHNGAERLSPDTEVSFVPMSAVDEVTGRITIHESRTLQAVTKGYTSFRDGDVLFAKITPCMENGKAAIARDLLHGVGFGSTEFHVLRPKSTVLAEWIFGFLRQPEFRALAKSNFTGTAGQQRVPTDFLNRVEVPVPPFAEQQRLVQILQDAEEMRILRLKADERLRDLNAAIFDEIFSSNRAAAEGWPTKPLGDLTSNVSGGTPSTENPDFWSGTIPWISPKDMKSAEIFDATDHVSELAVKASRLRLLPKNTVVTVVRGMILAHTFPVAITRVEATINQDMKGFFVRSEILPDYLHWALAASNRKLLSLVSTAGHGTKRLELDSLLTLPIVVPPKEAQKEFVSRIADARAMVDRQQHSAKRLGGLFDSLLNRAFRGQL